MTSVLDKIESFLKLSRLTSTSELMRARAVYLIGIAFVLTQYINQAAMYQSYRAFTFDHMISAVACIAVVGTVLLLRKTTCFPIFATIYSSLIVVGVLASAIPEQTGINSALIPLLVLGIVANGFICGWRATAFFGLVGLGTVWALWWVSAGYNKTPIFDVEAFADRNYQRAVQASLAIFMISTIASLFSHNMHNAFGELESGIEIAQTSDRAKTDFLSTMSHELCTPMNGIIGVGEMLSETDLNEDQRELTEMIQSSGSHLQHIIGNVLLFSQLEADRILISHEPFDIAAVANRVAFARLQSAQEKGLALHLRVDDDLARYRVGDERRIEQVLAALLDNAVKFTDAGSILVHLHAQSTDASDGTLHLDVHDTGPGISEGQSERIFERFTQVDGSIKRLHGGTGLGLTVAQGLATCMGGSLSVKSRLGEGSVFSLKLALPLAETPAEMANLAAE